MAATTSVSDASAVGPLSRTRTTPSRTGSRAAVHPAGRPDPTVTPLTRSRDGSRCSSHDASRAPAARDSRTVSVPDWFGPLVAWGELLIGIALIIGAFVGVAAFFGMFMNWNFIMAGAASTNGLLLVAAFLLVLAWKVAGYIGADYFLLRWLGVPWKTRETSPPPASTPTGQLSPTAQ